LRDEPVSVTPVALDIEVPASTRGWREAIGDFCRRRTLGAIGAVVIVVMFAVASLAELISPYNPVAVDFAAMLSAPSPQHWLGTDAFGRDVLSRLIYGSRTALLVGFGAAFIGATAGAILGVGSA
jgi:peptide/nickel transport system permease protein